MFEPSAFWYAMPLLLEAARMTVFVSLIGLFLGFFVAIAVVNACLSRHRLIRRVGNLYTFVFRGIPMLVQLMMAYYFLPSLGVNVSPVTASIVAITLCEGAYLGEILRGGFLGIPTGQVEAAQMLGLSRGDTLFRIKVPQAVRLTSPSLVSEMILLIKASALISVVGVTEITRMAQNIAASTYQALEAYAAAGAMYMLICGVLAVAGHYLERRYGNSGA